MTQQSQSVYEIRTENFMQLAVDRSVVDQWSMSDTVIGAAPPCGGAARESFPAGGTRKLGSKQT